MIQNLKISLALLLLFTLVFETGELVAKSNRKPKWISNRPIDNNYYIGIGKSSKIESKSDYIQIAKNNALADMISEISVSISSNSILNQLEDNSGYKETYIAKIEMTAKDDIDGYEIVDSWENKEEYWVYYRLSKFDYKRKKREVLDRAKNHSKNFYEKAQESEREFDINNALIYYIQAFDAIQKHIGEDLSVFTFDGRIHLDNAIYQSIQSIFSRLRIIPEKEVYTLQALSSNNEPVYVKIKLRTDLETQNISNLPIRFSFPDLNMNEQENVISLMDGKAECTIANKASKGRNQIIKAELDTEVYFGEDAPDNLLKNLFKERGTNPYGNVNIVVKEIFAYLESQEIFFGNINSNKSITKLFKEELSENFFSFTNDKENADVYIKINSEVTEGTKLNKHNLHTAFLNCDISITDANSELEIYNNGLKNIKGIKSGNFEIAAQDAILKAEKKMKNEIIPSIRKINL